MADEVVDAKKDTLDAGAALALARRVREIYAAKGQKVIHLDLAKDKPDDETLKQLLLGPSGNLRAPTLKIGKTLLVGFQQAMYEKVFG